MEIAANALADAIEYAVRQERRRCAKLVAEMRNQRDAYRKILGEPAAELPKHGHWADPFFEEAERNRLPPWATELAERAYLTPGSPVNAFAHVLVAARAEDERRAAENLRTAAAKVVLQWDAVSERWCDMPYEAPRIKDRMYDSILSLPLPGDENQHANLC